MELLEERGGSQKQGHNDFRKLMADLDSGYEAREEEKKAKAAHRTGEGGGATLTGTAGGQAVASTEGVDGAGAIGDGEVVDILAEGKKGDKRKGAETGPLDLSLIRTDPNKLYPLIYYFWKVSWVFHVDVAPRGLQADAPQNLLKEWEEWMDARPGKPVVTGLLRL